MINRFVIEKNHFLKKDIVGYYHQYYTGYRHPDNPDFLNTLKNTFDNISKNILIDAKNQVIEILVSDLSEIVKKNNLSNCMFVCVPRAKSLISYSSSQLMLKEAVKDASKSIYGVQDGTDCIRRVVNTFTTHFRNAPNIVNDGDEPYPGITNTTCAIDSDRIRNQNIILIDDIYTKNVNIDEDCIQALLDNGAKSVIFYTIGYTRRPVQ